MLLQHRRRIARQRLAAMWVAPPAARRPGADGEPEPVVDTIARTVHHHLAMQAQDLESGMWSLGLRTGAGRADVEAAIEARLVTRSWPMRGTLHLMATQDVRWMCRLLNARMESVQRARYDQLGLTARVVGRAREAVVEALAGGLALSRPDAFAILRRHGIDPDGQRGYHLLGRFCMEGLICQGPVQGRQPTFVLIDDWVPWSWEPAREEAMAALAERYVASHGPVTLRDLTGWTNQNLTFAREALALAGDRVAAEEIGGHAYLVPPGPPRPAPPGLVRLLPGFDEYLLGYKDRSAALTAQEELRVVPGKNGMFLGTVVTGGLVVGTWNRRATSRHVIVTVTPFGAFGANRRRDVDRAAAAYGRFLGAPVEVRYAP